MIAIILAYPTLYLKKTCITSPGGIIENNVWHYILLTPVVFGPHTQKEVIYMQAVPTWKIGTYHDDLVLETIDFLFAKEMERVFLRKSA